MDVRLGVVNVEGIVNPFAQVFYRPFLGIEAGALGRVLQPLFHFNSLLVRELRRAPWSGFVAQDIRSKLLLEAIDPVMDCRLGAAVGLDERLDVHPSL